LRRLEKRDGEQQGPETRVGEDRTVPDHFERERVPSATFSLKDNNQHMEFKIADLLRSFPRGLGERLVQDKITVLQELDTMLTKMRAKMAVKVAETQ
ncbi:Glutamate decarboxylase, partial [Linum grandiflorum]